MKFGKKLRATVDESYEEWRPMFMSYKDLKKRIHPRTNDDVDSKDSDSKEPDDNDSEVDIQPPSHTKDQLVAAVMQAERGHTEFFSCFRKEVDKVNNFFLDKQEDYIIEHQQLSAKVDEYLAPGRATRREVNRLCQRLTNFHGELVLLENFSTVNYTGFRKILKKHDKKTGLNMQNVYLKTVLITPFFLSDTVRKLILKTESQLAQLDRIRKFRRTSTPSAIALDRPSPASVHLNSSSRFTSPAPAVPPLPLNISPGPQVVMEQPRPHAFISPRSALWRLYRDAREFGGRVRAAMAAADPDSVPSPPASLIALVDEVEANELGLNHAFLNAVTQPSNYFIASEQNFSMGFFVFGPGTRLQIFNSLNKGAFITRNLRGKAHLRCYETCANLSTSTTPSEDGTTGLADEKDDFCVEEKRNGRTTGPWPAVTTCGAGSHVEWMPQSWCAVFYVCMPALTVDELPRFEMRPLTPPRSRVTRSRENGWPFARVLC